MTGEDRALLKQVARLNVWRRGERRAPHKPLLLLVALGRLLGGGRRRLSYAEVEQTLRPLLEMIAPPVAKCRHSPDNSYWYQQNDGLWTVDQAEALERTRSGYPTMAAFRSSTGGLPDAMAEWLLAEPALAQAVVQQLLVSYFPETLHEDICLAVGLKALAAVALDALMAEVEAEAVAGAEAEAKAGAETGTRWVQRRARDPAFRSAVLEAYEYRCAFSGFRAALAGSYTGCEAAHVQWHAYAGPDSVANGLALEPTMHKLFDLGAWTLTDDRRILVSARLTGSDVAMERVRVRHGEPLLEPLPGQPLIDLEF
ncbi:hypothetical protein CKO36_19140, partial [Rhabdochromatium marinum]|nr:hypothetical protein [Rhabdochromatium marinum]